jgi:predicted RNA-binding Zn ribbon-like protein
VTAPPVFEFVAGHLALDFVNTVDWRGDAARRMDRLVRPRALVLWGRKAGVISVAQARALNTVGDRDMRQAVLALQRARRLRELLARVFAATVRGAPPSRSDLRRLNAFTSAALRRRRLELSGADYAWGWSTRGRALDSILWPIVLAAADLLTPPARSHIRSCAAHDCGWLFLDTSRNGTRRWCTMRSCGNRAKARRFYARSAVSSEG